MRLLTLAGLLVLNTSCKPDLPEYDRCILLVEAGYAHCFPRNQPGKAEYQIPIEKLEEQRGMTGYHCVSTIDAANIFKYAEEVEEACKDD